MRDIERRVPITQLKDPKLLSANLIAFIVAACGGGGGGMGGSTPVPASNNAPMAGSDTSISLTEDVTAGALNLSAPTDSDGDSLTIAITAIPISGTLNKADGTVLANGDALTISELEDLTFTPDSNTNGTAYGSFSYSVSDGNGGTDTRAITFSVDAVNDLPNAGIIVTELAPTENTTALTTFTATDADGDTLIYSISGGTDQDLFQIDSATGVLTFISAPDYENPLDADTDNVYDVQVSATDPSGASTSVGYVVTVNNAAEPETVSGTVVDGLVSGATVKLLDANGNVLATTTTDANGQYTLEATESIGTRIVVDGGTDTATGEAVTITLSASKTSKYVSAITTIIDKAGADSETIITNLGLPTGFDPATDNPLDSVAAQKVNATLINIIAVGESLLEGAGLTDNTGDELVTAEIVTALKAGKSLSDATTVTEVLTNSATDTVAETRVSELVTEVTASVVAANEVIADATDITEIAKVQKLVLDDDGGVANDISTAASGTATYVAETKTEIETNTVTVDVIGNQTPTAITLSTSSFNENAAGVTVGTLSATDPDTGETFTYSISGTDKESFELSGTTLKLKDSVSADFETDASYSITLTATDSADNTVSKDYTITVSDVNETPSAVALSTSSFAENAAGVTVGTLSATDPDTGETFTYSISGTDKESFELSGTTLKLKDSVSADFETDASYSITLTATDSADNTVSKDYTITVSDVNETPSAVALSTSSFAENAAGVTVGTLSATDPDTGETFTYSISGTDKESFELSGTTLKLKDSVSADFETDASYSITLTATDSADNTVSKDYTITVSDVNETPSAVALSTSSFAENAAGVTVGTLSATDPDTGETFTYSISGTDKESFELSGTTLKLKDSVSADFETDASYSITLTATDSADNTVSKDYTITVSDVNETPSITSASTSTLSENTSAVITLTGTDPDSDTLTYSITGGADASLFTVNSSTGVLSFITAPDYETPEDLLPTFESGGDPDIPRGKRDNTYEVQVTATDSSGLSVNKTIFASVSDVNETISGKLIDGYIGGATVFQDLDNDGVLDAGEPYTTTDSTGAFSLTLQSASSDTPVRVINSGFDTATNDVLTASLDISATSSGSYILTPLSTLSARMLSFDSDLYKDTAEQIVADAFGITLSDAPSTSLFGYDPIATMIGSDASLATKAQPVYTANQLLMTLGHLTSALGEHMGPTALASVQTAIQTVLDNASKSATASLSWGDKTTLKSEAHESFMNALAEHLIQHKPSIDGFRMEEGSITLTDYLSSDADSTNVHQLYTSHSGTTLTANLVGGTMDQTNLSNIVSSDSSSGKSPVLSFKLNSIPTAGESGTSSITLKLYDGSDATQASGERLLQTTISVNWTSDGSTVSMTLPAQSLTIDYFTIDGTLLQSTYTNPDADIVSVITSGTSVPSTSSAATLNLKLASFFSGKGEGAGVDLSDYITSGNYFFDVGFTGLDFLSSADSKFTNVQGAFTVATSPGVAAYAEDVVVSEGAGTASVKVTLSKAAASDVTIDYQTANGTTTSSDFTSTSGTLTIAAGDTSGTISIPITNDTTAEAQENLTLNLSNASGATLGKSAVTVSIVDNEAFLTNSTAVADVLSTTLESLQDYLTTTIKSFLNSNSLTVDGVSKTYATILSDYGSVTDLDTWIKTYTESMTSGATKSMTSFITAIDSYVTSSSSGTPTATDLATALTKVNVGIKAIDFSQILGGTLIGDSGTFANSVTQSSFDSSLSGKVTSVVNLAADTIGDVLGTDTATNFPNATIKILTSGDDTANGTSGSDLIASLNGADTVNALAGNDKMIGGTGVDTFDGGEGNDHIYGYTGNDSLTGGAGNDKIVGGLGNDTLTGGAGNDTLWGQTGNDTITTGAGSDDADGGLGDDTIYVTDKSGPFTDTIKGSAGTDTLDINYSGITSLKDFTLSSSGSNIVLTDASGGSITFSNIENLTVNSIAYIPPPSQAINSGDGGLSNAFYSTAEKSILSYGSAVWYVQNLKSSSDNYIGFGGSDDVTFVGSSSQETINLNVNRSSEYSGNLTITMGDGNDSINSAKVKNTDSIDMGAGDDTVSLMINGSYGTPSISAADFTKLDGGAGTDTLSFEEGTPDANTELTLTTGGAVNFENLKGGSNAEVLKGDNNANVLTGNNGADTLYGYGGNDTLHADSSGMDNTGNQTSADVLYGGAGNDTLHGNAGDNTLDGGTGADTIYSGGGSDMIILRSGDGGATQSDGDTFTDFTDGTDSLGLDNSLSFTDLTIEQSGSDTVIKEGSNYLMTLTGISTSNISILDFQSTDSSNQTINGTSGDDGLVGGAGGDTFNGGAGSDSLVGWNGTDTFNIRSKTGSYADSVNGGAGTDTLDINYSGITSLKDFTLSSSGSNIVLTDASGGSITFSNIENLTVNSIAYIPPPSQAINSGDGGLSNAFYSTAEKSILSYGSAVWYVQNLKSSSDNYIGFGGSDDVTFVGSSSQETINLNVNRSSEYSGNLTITMGDGNDSINSAKVKNTDSIDMGAGDDTVSLMINGSYGTPSISAADFTKLDGGAGTDTLSFEEGTPDANTELTLTTGGAVNFENLKGGSNAEVLKGDNNANVLTGNNGADTLYGYGGNDTLHADSSGMDNTGNQTSADVLYGGAGNDTLHGNAGDNTLDGGTGADTIYSGGGSDTIVIRSGDGSTSLVTSPVIKDFTDNSDILGMDSLSYSDLTIEQGTGDYLNHTLVKITSSDEYLLILENISAINISVLDFSSTSTDALILNGTSGDDGLVGGAGGDTFNGGAGSDTLLGFAGNDTFNIRSKTGSYADSVNGGAGTDTLDINYSGITSLKDFTLSSSGSNIVLTDASGGSITFSNIENLTVNSIAYIPPPSQAINSGDGGLSNAFYSTAEKSILSYGSAVWYVQNLKSSSDNYIGFGGSDDVTFVGSSSQETINLNVNRSSEYSGNLTITMGDGNDSINSAKVKNTDSIDMGAGDDTVSLMINGSYGTPSISAADFTKLDGGAGTDTLSFEEGTPDANTELTLTTGGAVNFENLKGGSNAEVLKGDNNANVLTGNNGADTLYGYGGNDTLHADSSGMDNTGNQTSADVLYGGAGNDTLHGNAGDNTLDGGTGADTIYSGGGVDTFVLRAGSGGTAITDADTFKDFTDGTDLIGLDNGLAFGDLTIEQGTGSYSSHTVIKAGSEYLAVVENMTASDLTESSFTPVDINETGHMTASFFFGTNIDSDSLDIDLSNISNLPPNDINLGLEGLDSEQLPVIEENNKIELNLEEDLSEILLEVKDPEPVSETVDNDIGYFVGTAYEEDELLFAGLEI